jgi:transglutaminase-like putative cysteine protease
MGDLRRMSEFEPFLRPTPFLESDSEPVRDYASRATVTARGEIDQAIGLYYAIRDGIRYDPYVMATDPEQYRASVIARLPAAYCIQKAILLAASARAIGVPSRLGFADVRNHLTSPKLRETMGSDLFVYHGYTELFLEGRWVKATPAFNLGLCQRFGVLPLEFDGRHD